VVFLGRRGPWRMGFGVFSRWWQGRWAAGIGMKAGLQSRILGKGRKKAEDGYCHAFTEENRIKVIIKNSSPEFKLLRYNAGYMLPVASSHHWCPSAGGRLKRGE